MSEHYFTCPKCGGHYFGRDVERGEDGKVTPLLTVRCNSDGCDWRGVWPPKEPAE